MRQPMVAGNWKLNGSSESNKLLIDGIKQGLGEVKKAQVVVCPPSVYLGQVNDLIDGTEILLGVQNVSEQVSGAYTGEISVSMLGDFSCKYAILGHSERRSLYAESDELVAKKFAAVKEAHLVPIFCVGELLEEREANQTEDVVARQIDAVIDLVGISAFKDVVIAYEPVWAIGTGKTATPQQAQDVHAFIRQRLATHDAEIAQQTRILYGGSVKPSNAKEIFNMPDIDGGLIGGASLKAEDFLAICTAAN